MLRLLFLQEHLQFKQNSIHIFVKLMNNTTIILEINKNDTIDMLKQKICMRENIPLMFQRLVYSGKELSNLSLQDYNINNDSTIHLFSRLSGDIKLKVFLKRSKKSFVELTVQSFLIKDIKMALKDALKYDGDIDFFVDGQIEW